MHDENKGRSEVVIGYASRWKMSGTFWMRQRLLRSSQFTMLWMI